MALLSECMPKFARKLLDTADIVRDATAEKSCCETRGANVRPVRFPFAIQSTPLGESSAILWLQLVTLRGLQTCAGLHVTACLVGSHKTEKGLRAETNYIGVGFLMILRFSAV